MFITQGICRHEHQFDPERTYWHAFEIDLGTRVHMARTVGPGGGPTRLIMICSSSALLRALVDGVFGQVEQLWSVGRFQPDSPINWVNRRVEKFQIHYLDLLGGIERIEVVLDDGNRYWVPPATQAPVSHSPKTIWEATQG